jgi:DNA-binding transcriptional ArsR family regulator
LTNEGAGELARLFKVLASDTRLRLLHALVKANEMCVSELADAVSLKPQAVSNQLQGLAARGIVGTRRNGLNIYYRIVDPCVVTLLDQGLCLVEDATARAPKRARPAPDGVKS